jgi:hypothetical protein
MFVCSFMFFIPPVTISSGLYPPEIVQKMRDAQHLQLSDLISNLQKNTSRKTKFNFNEVWISTIA